jgi:hypothetical protein
MSSSIEEFIAENKDTFESIAIKRNIDNELQERALKVVREFIAERKLILYGGIAIDYALRLKGTQWYTEDVLPDYDFYSSRHVEDSYDLAEILVKANFKNVDAIRGFHVQTQRVRVESIVVADISYCPKAIYDKLKNVQYKNVLIIHPDYQRMDMHNALSFPFDGIPNFPSFQHRWKKDIKRFNLFEEHYPIEIKELSISGSRKEFTLPSKDIQFAICGVAAYAILLAEMKKIDKDSPMDIANISVQISGAKIIVDPCPENELVITSPEPEKFKGKEFYAYMDWLPKHMISGELKILSTKDKMLSISIVNGLNICSPQYLMKYFLCMWNITRIEFYKILYVSTLRIVQWADKYYQKSDAGNIEYNPFLLPLKFLGDKSVSEAQQIARLGLLVQQDLATTAEKELLTSLGKKGWYPEQGQDRPKSFNTNNVLFKMDGSAVANEK